MPSASWSRMRQLQLGATCAVRGSAPDASQRAVASRRQCPGEDVNGENPVDHPTRKRSEGNFLAGMGVGVLVGLGGLARHRLLPEPHADPVHDGEAQAGGKERAAKPPAIAGLPQGGAAPSGTAEKPKFDFYRILPGAEEPVTEKEIRERLRQKGSTAGQQEASKDVYFIQAGLVPEPRGRRQPEGAARDPRLRVERRARPPPRQGHLVPRADGALRQAGGDQQGAPGARAERYRRQPD